MMNCEVGPFVAETGFVCPYLCIVLTAAFIVITGYIREIMWHTTFSREPEFVSDHYTAEDKQRFTAYIEQQLERISIPNKDVDFLRGKMLLMYANPLKNYLAAIKE